MLSIITAHGSTILEFVKETLLFKVNPDETVLEWYPLHKSGVAQ